LAILVAALVVILRPRPAEGREVDHFEIPVMAIDDLPSVVRALQVVGVAPVKLLKGVMINVEGRAFFEFGAFLPPGLWPAYEKARRAIDPMSLDLGPLMADLVGPIADGADRGDPEMILLLAHIHRVGLGVPKDADEGLRLVRLAAETGHLVAANILGEMLLYGDGTLPDFDEAVVWLRRALPFGANRTRMALWYARIFRPDLVARDEAVGGLVTAFSRGDGLAREAMEAGSADHSPTVEDLRLAARDGGPGDNYNLGIRLLFGPPEERDAAEGVAALRQVADGRVDSVAQLLSRIYREGVPGCPRDEAEADKWALAAKRFKEERLGSSFRPDAPASPGSAAGPARAGRAGQGAKPRKGQKAKKPRRSG
jgi:TPR repeat protein